MKKLFESLAFRLSLAIAAVMVAAFAGLVYVYQQSIKVEFYDFISVGEVAGEFTKTLQPGEIAALGLAYDRGGWDALAAALPAWLEKSSYVLVEPDGKIIFSPFGRQEFAEFDQIDPGVYRLTIGQGGNPQIQLVGVMGAPLVASDGGIFGHILLVPMPVDTQSESFATSVSKTAAGFVILIVIGTLLLVGFSVRTALLPVHLVTRAARKLQDGQIPDPVNAKASGEVGELVTAFNSAIRELARTGDMRKKIISDVAHELRTPVTNLKGQLEALEAGLIKKDKEFLKIMQVEVGLLEHLIEDLQDLAIFDAGQLKIYPEELNLKDQVAAAFTAFRWRQNVKLENRIDPAVFAKADPRRLRQVLNNLFSNARQSRKSGLVVTTQARVVKEFIEISVTDNGPGIPLSDLPHVFERFWRADQSRTRDTGGAGLGLAIVKTLVEAHGGRVSIISENGTTVTFSLPK